MNLCKINYIEELPDSQEEKDRLTKLHLGIARKLYERRVDNSGYTDQLFKFNGEKLFVPGEKFYYNEAQKFLKIINDDLGFIGARLIQDEVNTARHFVELDVRKDRTVELSEDANSNLQTFYKNYFGETALITEGFELEDAVENHSQIFKDLTDRVYERGSLYLNNSTENNATTRNLKMILGSMKDKSTYGILESLNKYVSTASFSLNNLNKRMTIIDNKLRNLSSDPTTRKEQLKQVGDFVRYSSYYYHLFDTLGDIDHQLAVLGVKERAIDGYERDLLETRLREWLEGKEVFTTEEINSFLNQVPTAIEDTGNMYNIIKQQYRDKLGGLTLEQSDEMYSEMMSVLENSMKKNGSIQHSLRHTIDGLKPFKQRIQDLHYETLVEIYYPLFERSFEPGAKSIDGKEDLDKKWKLNKEDFKTLLKLGEEDVSMISKWGSAMINVKDTIPVTIANFFKEVMIDIDLNNKEDIQGLQSFLIENDRIDGDDVLQKIDKQIVHDNLLIENIEEVDENYIGDTVSIKTLGVERIYKARKTRNFLNEFNNIAYNNNKKAFESTLGEVVDNLANQLFENTYALVSLRNHEDPILKRTYNLMYRVNKDGEELVTNNFGKFLSESPALYQIKDKLRGMLWSSFYKDNIEILPAADINKLFKDQKIVYNDDFVDLNDDNNAKALQFVLRNTYRQAYKETKKGDTLKDKFQWGGETLFGVGETNKTVLVQFTDLTYGYVDLLKVADEIILSNTSGKDIQDFFTYSGKFNALHKKYHITNGSFGSESLDKWNLTQKDKFSREYFNKLIDLYKGANKNYYDVSLQFREVPQVDSKQDQSKLGGIKDSVQGKTVMTDLKEYAKSYTLDSNVTPTIETYIDDNGEEQQRTIHVSREKQYINSQKVRLVPAKFNTPIALEKLESNLYKSVLLYKTASNVYRGMKNNESQALMLQTILEGDTTLGIKPRAVKEKNFLGENIRVTGGGIKLKDTEVRSSQMIISFINDYIYNIEREDYGILGSTVSAKKVAGLMSGLTAYTALAWNISTMPANFIIAAHNSRAVSKGNQWFNQKDWFESEKEYAKNYAGFVKDFGTKSFIGQKSLLSQLMSHHNALQGEFLSPNGIIVTKNVLESMFESALFWTQNIVEHANQGSSMIMLMKGYFINNEEGNRISMWDAYQKANVGLKDGETMIKPPYLTRDQEIQFQKRLHGVNRQIHGNYQQLDKTMLQKNILTNMMMTFKRFIYDGFRSRYMSERYDQELRSEEEGYFRTYLKQINTEFTQIAKTQGLTAALKAKGFKTVGSSLLKTSLAGWDAATFRLASKNKKVKDYLYGEDITERQYYAAMRATYDVGNIIRVILMGVLIETILSGLDDDDEFTKAMLSYASIYANRLESDIGFFTSFTNFSTGGYAGPTLDQMYRFVKEPLAAVRMMDNTSGIFSQLISHDWVDEEGNFGFQWNGLEKYEKSGSNYEKGDYKIVRKIQKSIISPWWQIIKALDYEQQLKFQGLIYKHSK